MSDLEAVLRRFVRELEGQAAPFAVVGGLAVSARTEPRFTRDAGVCVAVDSDAQAEELVRSLRAAGYELISVVEQEAVARFAMARLADPLTSLGRTAVDLLFASSGIEHELVAQAETIELFEGVSTPVATVPALLALKVLSRDDAKRPQDRVDALALLAVSTPPDQIAVRTLLATIERRGFARNRNLQASFDDLIAESRPS